MNTLLILAILLTDNGGGTTVLPLLGVGAGPRAGAMGEAFVGLADDATSIFWNPAGMAQAKNMQFFLAHHEWFYGIRDEYGSAVLPVGPGRLGIGLVYSGTSGVESWNAGNMPGETLSAHTGIADIGYGASFLRHYSAGASLKFLYDRLGSENGLGACLDLGALAKPLPYLSVGLSAHNLGFNMRYSNGSFPLPTNLALGAAYRSRELNVSTDFVVPLDGRVNWHLGAEYTAFDIISFRAGYKTGPQDIRTLGLASGICLGLGVRIGNFALDYGFEPYGTLGMTHRLGVRTTLAPRGFGTLVIKVTDLQDKDPLSADLELTGLRQGGLAADANGKARVDKLPEGWLKVKASAPGYMPVSESTYVYGDREQTLNLSLAKPGRGTIYGRLFDAGTKEMIGGRIEYRGIAQGGYEVNPKVGSFILKELLPGDYQLTASGPTQDYFPQTCTVQAVPARITNRDFYLLRRQTRIILRGVNFETGKADLRPQDLPNLDDAGRILVENPKVVVELGGHTDPREINTPDFPSNWELSQGRAQAVRKYLIERFKIDPERLIARGYADTRPIAPNTSEEGMAKNRRTEFVVLEQ